MLADQHSLRARLLFQTPARGRIQWQGQQPGRLPGEKILDQLPMPFVVPGGGEVQGRKVVRLERPLRQSGRQPEAAHARGALPGIAPKPLGGGRRAGAAVDVAGQVFAGVHTRRGVCVHAQRLAPEMFIGRKAGSPGGDGVGRQFAVVDGRGQQCQRPLSGIQQPVFVAIAQRKRHALVYLREVFVHHGTHGFEATEIVGGKDRPAFQSPVGRPAAVTDVADLGAAHIAQSAQQFLIGHVDVPAQAIDRHRFRRGVLDGVDRPAERVQQPLGVALGDHGRQRTRWRWMGPVSTGTRTD